MHVTILLNWVAIHKPQVGSGQLILISHLLVDHEREEKPQFKLVDSNYKSSDWFPYYVTNFGKE